jgi:hypothetical protein
LFESEAIAAIVTTKTTACPLRTVGLFWYPFTKLPGMALYHLFKKNAAFRTPKLSPEQDACLSLVEPNMIELALVVQAITSAAAKCTATGNAYGCASAGAAARAWAFATASAHASAVAEAVNYCHCKDADAFATAWASGSAGAFTAQIAVDVASEATGAVCVSSSGPGSFATAEVSVLAKCIEKKYAYVMAEATAKALVAGKCEYGLEAQAEIDALTQGTLVSYSNC